MIILTTSFLKDSVFEMFSVHTKTPEKPALSNFSGLKSVFLKAPGFQISMVYKFLRRILKSESFLSRYDIREVCTRHVIMTYFFFQ